jgi:4-diphosphocytidyl-2-C-methyl-D-erythritol kinase
LNLTLQIVGRRPDGYHLLDSLVAFTELGDTIAAEESDALTLALDGPFGAALGSDGSENLVLRAARMLRAEAGVAAGAALRLTKRLPIASGIGGGSSDAAATLLALSRLWRLAPAAEDLARLGLALGADVPVCLAGRTARLEGIGERIGPGPDLPPCPLVLVNPGIGLPTPQVFRARRGAFSAGAGPLAAAPRDAEALAAALAPFGNDLTEAAISLLPVIAEMLAALETSPGTLLARMSGSGATCFALFASEVAATAAAAAVGAAHPGWWVAATRLKTA